MPQPSDNYALSASGVHKHYGDTHALNDVALDVARGEICAVLGQNGAGKTTFIHCALGLTKPNAGELQVLGHRAGSIDARRATGVMLQDTDLPELLSAREHLSLYARYFPQPQAVDALIDYADIGDFADQRYKSLSGGQKRRVQFALALIGQPRLLFLDEPTTGLDQDARRAVWRNVRRLAETGTTVILTTHYLEEADALADRIIVINAGEIIADGDAQAVRERVGGALISCQTSVDANTAAQMPAVQQAQMSGRLLSIVSNDAAATLGALLAADPGLKDLSVRKPSLDEAFSLLTGNHRESQQ